MKKQNNSRQKNNDFLEFSKLSGISADTFTEKILNDWWNSIKGELKISGNVSVELRRLINSTCKELQEKVMGAVDNFENGLRDEHFIMSEGLLQKLKQKLNGVFEK